MSSRRTQLEKEIEADFVSLAERLGVWCPRLAFEEGRGWADRTLFLPGGQVMFAEFKRPRVGRLSAHQKKIRDKLQDLGFEYYVETVADGEVLSRLNELLL